MEILQGSINREDYYSVKECAEILGVTTKTIRNRIDCKKINAIWYEVGKGQSQWLIYKDLIKAIIKNKESKISNAISIPQNLIEEIIKTDVMQKAITIAIKQETLGLKEEIIEMKINVNNHYRIIDERLRQSTTKKSFWQRLFHT
jgi:plasmid maintenance system antidote protein VapI